MIEAHPAGGFVSGVSPASQEPGEADGLSWWFAFRKGRLLVKDSGQDLEVPLLEDLGSLDLLEVRRQYLGSLDGRHCYSVELAEDSSAPEPWSFQTLRWLFQRLPQELFWIAGRAIQIVDWDRKTQYCGRCGHQNHSKREERAKECANCGLVTYPRISPAIIVLVHKGPSLLLARAHRHPPGFYSVLAGFVEPGESLEAAVAREIREEVGLEVEDISYFGSQPWPFPDSLMVAFTCRYAGGEITIEEEELEDAGWYQADSLPKVPPRITIARQMIDWFVDQHSNQER